MEKNVSDQIEAYLKQLLQKSNQIELTRADLARRFSVVPSQINYVIKTRFTIERGYLVESKRGGGGYLRVAKLTSRQEAVVVETLVAGLTDQVSLNTGEEILHCLALNELLTQHEVALLQVVLSKAALAHPTTGEEEALRAQILKQLLNRLRFESERE